MLNLDALVPFEMLRYFMLDLHLLLQKNVIFFIGVLLVSPDRDPLYARAS